MGHAATAKGNPEASGELMRFLIDECLHTPLVALAHIGCRDLVSALIEVEITDAGITCQEFRYP
jgi:hypothetical protein